MITDSSLCDVIYVQQERYEELLKAETTLGIIEVLYNTVPRYDFHNVVGYVLGLVAADE